jgi:hypothetical protein
MNCPICGEHVKRGPGIISIPAQDAMYHGACYVNATLDATYQRPPIRTFESGATRDTDDGKPDYEGFLSPLVIEAFGEYMTRHRIQSDGDLRASDNWQRGIPKSAYIKSAWRHFMDWWKEHRGIPSRDGLEEALGGLIFNAMGYWHETIKERDAE